MSDPQVSHHDAGESPDGQASSRRLISASTVMLTGTLVSRLVGFGRFVLLAFLFGIGTRQADMFAVANTVPNSMYILLAGGVLNTVLVPQIVRAIRTDPDGGEAYTNRILTGGLIVLFTITLLLTLAVPAIISLYTAGGWKSTELSGQYQSMVVLGYYCMPQVFFYGVHVLVGQVLNARDRFGPMMWAPIANNVVSIAVLLLFWVVFGQTTTGAAFTDGQELLLGLGSTLGIAIQAVVLVPYLRRVGFTFQPRFDFRRTGLGKTVRLAKWTLGFVIVSQAGLVVVNKVASAATVGGSGGGVASYQYAYALWIVPHSLITVSLATAMLSSASRLAHDGDLRGTAAEITRTVRLAVTALLPASVGFVVLGIPLARLIFGFGAGARDADFAGLALIALAVGLVPFTVQYICLRAFYALENTRTPFLLQVLITAANVGLGVLVVVLLDSPPLVAAGLALGFSLAYGIGVVVSFRRLQRDLPDLAVRPLARLCVRLLTAVAPAAALVGVGVWWVESTGPGQGLRALTLAAAGVVAVVGFLLTARAVGVAEVSDIVATVLRRSRPGAGAETGPVNPEDPGDSLLVSGPTSPTVETAGEAAAPQSQAGPIENAEQSMATYVTTRRTQDLADLSDDDPESATDPARPTPTPNPALTPAPRRSRVSGGTVLAGRYRLEELLAETTPTVTWRAFDLVLSRSVLVHVLAPHDPDADRLLALARQASVATDSRFLRVLDAVASDDDDIGSYIVCEYAVGKSLELLLSQGPLSGLEAAWVVREAADAISEAHALGLHHQRLSPDTIILTPDGHVKIVGLAIEAALRPEVGHPLPAGTAPERRDVIDLGRLLYGCLVSRWPGGPAFSLAAAPISGSHVLSPRQVRAGVSPALDSVTDLVLGDPPRHHAEALRTANGLVDALNAVLGPADASSDLERRLRQPIPRVTTTPPTVGLNRSVSATVTRSAPSAGNPVSPLSPGSDATRVTVIRNAPPPLGPAAPKPVSVRRPRRWIAVIAVMLVVLLGTAVGAAVLRNRTGQTAVPAERTGSAPSSAPPSTAPVTPYAIAAVRVFDPQGDPPNDENNDEAARAHDGRADTRWRTVLYRGDPDLGGIKRGVGLIVDLGSARQVKQVKLRLSGSGTTVQIRVPEGNAARTTKPPMNSDGDWRTVSRQSKAGATTTLTLEEPTQTRFFLVYLTSLPREGSGYRGGIFEVEVL